jgi:hypothetical protein
MSPKQPAQLKAEGAAGAINTITRKRGARQSTIASLLGSLGNQRYRQPRVHPNADAGSCAQQSGVSRCRVQLGVSLQ